jgi:hypothetical protein
MTFEEAMQFAPRSQNIHRIGTRRRPPAECPESVYFHTAPLSPISALPVPATEAEGAAAATLRSALYGGFEAAVAK